MNPDVSLYMHSQLFHLKIPYHEVYSLLIRIYAQKKNIVNDAVNDKFTKVNRKKYKKKSKAIVDLLKDMKNKYNSTIIPNLSNQEFIEKRKY